MKRSFLYLSEFHVGDKFTTLSRTVTETDVVLFAGITGDNNPIHTDRTYAEKLPFKSRIAHGLLGAGIATGLWGRMGLVDGIKEPKKVEMALWKLIPPEEGSDFCHRLVYHGRDVCTARTKPHCEKCCLADVCARIGAEA